MLFLFLIIFFIILIAKENTIVNASLAVPTGTPATVAREIIETPPAVAFNKINTLSM